MRECTLNGHKFPPPFADQSSHATYSPSPEYSKKNQLRARDDGLTHTASKAGKMRSVKRVDSHGGRLVGRELTANPKLRLQVILPLAFAVLWSQAQDMLAHTPVGLLKGPIPNSLPFGDIELFSAESCFVSE
jgi:hypothetical protein